MISLQVKRVCSFNKNTFISCSSFILTPCQTRNESILLSCLCSSPTSLEEFWELGSSDFIWVSEFYLFFSWLLSPGLKNSKELWKASRAEPVSVCGGAGGGGGLGVGSLYLLSGTQDSEMTWPHLPSILLKGCLMHNLMFIQEATSCLS